ncbi:uncharacterized protein Z518_03616 [Rhinocladiella mackenziei CBS 650.93]|uniref:Rhinocladiella mackenziei CBS 650.93 unplaced genomic scaffold supercont1.3, whole genome shotgun sequence n=1 Tax=Rhinocladiella mackenziei CBS 650.93 TaxID=1442369 RepID=A0A0D2IIS4_9EURO|nr:uncharacterized protein Z518_03616 [Rhinocladiella mackenziei CBS 650.93]KIX05644.1 hypothetical protein Z518_03616 [Rhinocladiella mackenziei CBS 650.93]
MNNSTRTITLTGSDGAFEAIDDFSNGNNALVTPTNARDIRHRSNEFDERYEKGSWVSSSLSFFLPSPDLSGSVAGNTTALSPASLMTAMVKMPSAGSLMQLSRQEALRTGRSSAGTVLLVIDECNLSNVSTTHDFRATPQEAPGHSTKDTGRGRSKISHRVYQGPVKAQRRHQARNENLLAAAIILRFYEELDYPLQDENKDHEFFLRVINIFIEAQFPYTSQSSSSHDWPPAMSWESSD